MALPTSTDNQISWHNNRTIRFSLSLNYASLRYLRHWTSWKLSAPFNVILLPDNTILALSLVFLRNERIPHSIHKLVIIHVFVHKLASISFSSTNSSTPNREFDEDDDSYSVAGSAYGAAAPYPAGPSAAPRAQSSIPTSNYSNVRTSRYVLDGSYSLSADCVPDRSL